MGKVTRREFIARSAAAAAGASLGLKSFGAPAPARVLGANERIRVGFIGVGNRGSQLLQRFMAMPDVEVAALADVYEPYLTRDRSRVDPSILNEITRWAPQMGEALPASLGRYTDFRRLLERKDIDAVCIATPDHWHAIQTIQAVESGKDVFVEKPLTITVVEGRRMVDAAKRTGRIVQVGLNRRGSSVYRHLAKEVQAGKIGKVSLARAYRVSNMYPDGIGNRRPEPPPPGLDWDMWLGPREYRPYQRNLALYKFRWWDQYSSQMSNFGVHYMDAIRWLIGEQAPASISAHGGKYVLKDDRTIPDTMEVTFEFASGAIVLFGIYEAGGGNLIPGGEVELIGAKASLVANERAFRIQPSVDGQFQNRGRLVAEEERRLADGDFGEAVRNEDSTSVLIRDFLDCMRSRRKPLCDLEEGHSSTTFAHLANIALATKTRLEWDAAREVVTNHPPANDLLHYEYRKPWTL